MSDHDANKNVKILFLDDNRQMRTLVRTMLIAFGFRQIWGANTTSEAQDLATDIRFDLIFVDQKLGNNSGLEFVRWLRDPDGGVTPFVPIIMISSFSERARIMDAINAGVDEFLVKPVKPVDVARRIDAVTFKRRGFIRSSDYFGPDRRRRKDPLYSGPLRRSGEPDHEAEEDVLEFD